MATQTLYPDGTTFTITGLSGTVDDVNEAPDGTWLTSNASNSTLRASFPTPSGDLNTGVGLQTLRVYVRKDASGGGTPTVDIHLYENGTDLGVILADTDVTSATGEWVTATFNASLLTNVDGSGVEIYCDGTKGGGGPNERNIEFDSIEFIADYSPTVYELDAETGSFSLTGQTADLEAARLLEAEAGSFALSGQAADLKRGYSLQAETGSFVLKGGGTEQQDSYYCDASDFGPNDPNSVWTDEANAVDGSTATSAARTGTGSLDIHGYNAPATGAGIRKVEGRAYGAADQTTPNTITVTWSEDNDLALLGFINLLDSGVQGWTNYVELSEHAGGWTWPKIQALESSAFGSYTTGTDNLARVEIRVTSAKDVEFQRGYTLQADTGSFTLTGQANDFQRSYALLAVHGYQRQYIDGSDLLSDEGGVWTDDSNAVDGNLSTFAYTSTVGTTTTNRILAGGVPSAWQQTGTLDYIRMTLFLRGFSTGGAAKYGMELSNATASSSGEGLTTDGPIEVVFNDPTVIWSDTDDLDFYVYGGNAIGTLDDLRVYGVLVEVVTENPAHFELSGQSADLTRALKLDASTGSFALTGQDATLTYNQGTPELDAEAGAFTLTGIAADLDLARRLQATAGSFALTGQAADLDVTFQVEAETGSFTLSGIQAELDASRALSADPGAFALSGQDSDLLRSLLVAFSEGTYTLAGADTELDLTFQLEAETGAFTLSGQLADLDLTFHVELETGSFALSGVAADLDLTRRIPADAGAFNLTGQDATLEAGQALLAETGSILLTGIQTELLRSLQFDAETGSYTITGIAADLTRSGYLGALAGTFTLSGTDADLDRDFNLAVDPGSFALAGFDADLEILEVLLAETGSFTLAGQAANLELTFQIDAETGSFTLAGEQADLTATRSLEAVAGAFSLVGQDAGFETDGELAAAPGAFALSGISADLDLTRRLEASAGSLALTGVDADFDLTFQLDAETGAFTLTGSDANLDTTGSFAAETGSFAISGQAAELVRALQLEAETGSFALAGQDAGLQAGESLAAEAGSFTATGQTADLLRSLRLAAETGTYTSTGAQADLERSEQLRADAGAFTLAGSDADLEIGYQLDAETGSFTLTGSDADFQTAGDLLAEPGAFALAGQDALLILEGLAPSDDSRRHQVAVPGPYSVIVCDRAREIRVADRPRKVEI